MDTVKTTRRRRLASGGVLLGLTLMLAEGAVSRLFPGAPRLQFLTTVLMSSGTIILGISSAVLHPLLRVIGGLVVLLGVAFFVLFGVWL